MGAGDVKLLAAFGAWLGPIAVLWAALWASLVGGVFAVVVAAWNGYLSEAIRNVTTLVGVWRVVGPSAMPAMTLTDASGPRLAYALPIGIGAVVALWFGID
jgi:prepilin peptidase CpaA